MAKPWDVVLFQRHASDDPEQSCPAEEFFNEIPNLVAQKLFSIIDAVAEAPPPQFEGGGKWEAMHDDMTGFYEARTSGPDHRLYRVFCILEHQAPGLDGPSIVIITGRSKPIGTAFTKADFDAVRRLGEEYRRHIPRNVV